MAVVLFLLSILINIFFPRQVVATDNLLVNSDFEDFANEVPNNWLKNYSTLTTSAATDSDKIHSGGKSVQFQSSSSSTKYLYQVIPISPNKDYHLSVWTKTISGSGSSYGRVTQCSDLDCKSEIKSDDSTHELTTAWKNLTLDFKTVNSALAVKVKISLDPTSSSGVSTVWDSIVLTASDSSASTSSASGTNPPVGTNPPTINFTPPGNLTAGNEFSVPVQVSNFSSLPYYIKLRIGPDENHLTHGQTANNGEWLSDNDSWSKFPQITGPNWQGTISAKLPSDQKEGTYKIVIRVKKVETDSFVESDVKDLHFAAAPALPPPPPPPQSASKLPTLTAVIASELKASSEINNTTDQTEAGSPDGSEDGKILGASTDSSNLNVTSKSKMSKATFKTPADMGKTLLSDGLIPAGLFIFGFAGIWLVRAKN